MSLDPIERTNLALSAGAVALSLAFASPAFAASLLAGAALESVNFRGLRRSAALFFGGGLPSSAGFRTLSGLRFLLLAVGIATGLGLGAHPVGFAIGLSLIMPAALIEAWRHRPRVDPNAPALAPDDPVWKRWDPWLAREREPREDDEREEEAG
jgi:hypothetical protein